MKPSKLYLAIAMALTVLGPARAAEDDLNVWAAATASIDVGKKGVVWLEAQTRLTDDVSRLGQLLVRPAIGYKLDSTTTVFLGYVYVRTDPVGPALSKEHRIFQQASFRLAGDGKGVTLTGRTRLEQRFRDDRSGTGLRLRQQLRLTAPLQDSARAVAWSEPFIGLNSTGWGQKTGVNVWRNFVGVSIPVSPRLVVEPGYLNQYVVRTGRDRVDHIASLTLNTRF